jgi:hypothetical protein
MDADEKRELLSFAEYEVHDFIAEHNDRVDKWDSDAEYREQARAIGLKRGEKWDPKAEVYPQKPSYTFQEFAGPVFELGGYGDMTLIDPYSQRRLWVSQSTIGDLSAYDAMILVLKIAQAIDFLDDREEEDHGAADTSSTSAAEAPADNSD